MRVPAREMLKQMTHDPDRRRIAELCGLDSDVVIAQRNAPLLPREETAGD